MTGLKPEQKLNMAGGGKKESTDKGERDNSLNQDDVGEEEDERCL